MATLDREPQQFDEHLAVLDGSVTRLREAVESLDRSHLQAQSYADEWTIAQVLSHIGSGAVILRQRIVDTLAGVETGDEYAPSVWDDWNAKPPEAQAADALVSDRALVETIAGVGVAARSTLLFPLGPMTLDLTGMIGLRINEHAVHSWDVEVALDPTAVLAADATAAIIDNLTMIAGFAGKPDGGERVVAVRTTEPERFFTLVITPDRVTLEPSASTDAADLVIPAEAFIRLVYGRMDRAHTPPLTTTVDLDALRQIFPGI